MNKVFSLLLMFLFVLSSCNEKLAPPPTIELREIILNQDSATNYKDSLAVLPVLHMNDEIMLSLNLNGNGSDLKTLNISSDNSGIDISISISDDSLISGDANFTDLKNDRMAFKDGVASYPLKVKLKVSSIENKKIKLSFHLSAQAECEKGGVLELQFSTGEVLSSEDSKNKQ